MTKRILSVALALILLCTTLPAAAEVAVLTPQEIQAARSLIAMEGDVSAWQQGEALPVNANALQAQQYLEWILEEKLGGLIHQITDSTQLLELASPGKGKTLDGLALTVQQVRNQLSYSRDELEQGRISIYNDLNRLEAGAAQREQQRIALRVRQDVADLQAIISAITSASHKKQYESLLNQHSVLLQNVFQSEDTPPQGALSDKAEQLLLEQAAQLTQTEQSNIDAQNGVDFSVLVLSTNQFGFIVRNADGKPLKGVAVKVSASDDPTVYKQQTTDENGLASFLIKDFSPDENNKVKVNAIFTLGYYCTREMRGMRIRGGTAETVRMEAYAGQPFLRMACYNGTDILSQQNSIFYTLKNDAMQQFTILIDDLAKKKISGWLYLCYQVYDENGKLTPKEDRVSFTSGTAVNFTNRYCQKIAPGSSVSVRVETPSFSKTYTTQLQVEKAVVEEPQFLLTSGVRFTGGGLKIHFPSSIPFIGGSDLSIDMPFVKAQLMIDPSGYVQFAYGRSFESEEMSWKSESMKDKTQRMDDANKQAQRDAHAVDNGVYKNAGATDRVKFLGNVTAAITVFAGMQGRIKEDATRFAVSGSGGIQAAFKGGYTWPFLVAGMLPAFAAMDFTFALGTSFGLGLEADLPNFGNPKFLFNKGQGLTVDIMAELGVSAGMGVRGLASLALRFFGNISPSFRLADPVSAAVNLAMGLEATAQLLLVKWKQSLWKGTYSYDTLQNGDHQTQADSLATAYTQLEAGQNIPVANAQWLPVNGEGLVVDQEMRVFDRLDSLAQEIQYATLTSPDGKESATFGFWITPVDGKGSRNAELIWYNLDHPSMHGVVCQSGDEWRTSQASDYAFAVSGHGDVVGVNVLSGTFEKGDSKPTESEMTLAVLKLTGSGQNLGLTLDAYRPKVDRATGGSWGGYYLTMPLIHFTNTAPTSSSCQWYMNAACSSEMFEYGKTYNICSVDYERNAKGSLVESDAVKYDPEHGDYSADPMTITRKLAAARPTSQRFDQTHTTASSLACYYRLSVTKEAASVADEETALYMHLNNTKRKPALDTDVVYFEPLIEYGALPDAKEFLFYLKKGQADDGSECYRLKGVSHNGKLAFTIVDYDVPLYAEHFKIATLQIGGSSVPYLYWTECVDSGEYTSQPKYLVKCVRFDRETNTMSDPFTLVQLTQQPSSVEIRSDGTGFYTVELSLQQNAASAAVSQQLNRFSFSMKTSLSLTGVAAYDPCVCAGEYASLLFAVKNTGNLPISRFTVAIMEDGKTVPLQTITVNCQNPQNGSVNSLFGNTPADSVYSVRRVDGIYDDMNGDSWLLSYQTDSEEKSVFKHTELLMPDGVHTYLAAFQVPESWNGNVKLTAEVMELFATVNTLGLDSAQNAPVEEVGFSSEGDLITNSPSDLNVQLAKTNRQDGQKEIALNRGDLMLDCQPYTDPNGEEYVRLSIVGRSQTSNADAPVLTASLNGVTVLSYRFTKAIDEPFGYTLDVPATMLLAGQSGGQVTFTLTGDDDFAEFDNQRTVALGKQLRIVRQPEDVTVNEGEMAAFEVEAEDGSKPYRYQWQRLHANGAWQDIAGADQARLTLTASVADNGAALRCVITDSAGVSITSGQALLTILSQPPRTGDMGNPLLWTALLLTAMALLLTAMALLLGLHGRKARWRKASE